MVQMEKQARARQHLSPGTGRCSSHTPQAPATMCPAKRPLALHLREVPPSLGIFPLLFPLRPAPALQQEHSDRSTPHFPLPSAPSNHRSTFFSMILTTPNISCK